MSKQTKSTPLATDQIMFDTAQAGAEQSPKPPATELPVSTPEAPAAIVTPTPPAPPVEQAESGKGDEPASSEVDPIMSLTEAGNMFGRSRQCVANWCEDGLLEYVRLPGAIGRRGIRRSTVLRFIGGTNVKAERDYGQARGLQETRPADKPKADDDLKIAESVLGKD